MRPRALRLLSAGGAPASWLRRASRSAARLDAMERGTAWAAALAAVHPSLRRGPMWGDALSALASLPSHSSNGDAPGEAAPGGFPRRATSAESPRSPHVAAVPPRTRADRASASPRRRPAASERVSSADAGGPAMLPRRATEAVLRPWSLDSRSTSRDAHAHGFVPAAGDPVAVRATAAWAHADAHSLRSTATAGERQVWTPSPSELPILAVRDRLHGWVAGRASARLALDPGFASGDGARRWIERVAIEAARRLPFSAGRGGADMAVDAIGPAAMRPTRRRRAADASPSADEFAFPDALATAGIEAIIDAADAIAAAVAINGRRPRLADEWSWPVDGPAAPADVLARLADRMPAAARAPSTARRNGAAARTGDAAGALPSPRRTPAGAEAGDGTDARQSISPSSHPLFHRRRTVSAADLSTSPAWTGASPDASARDHLSAAWPSAARSASLRAPSPIAPRDARAHAVIADGGDASRGEGEVGAGMASTESDRWREWPAVLPWPGRERTSPAGGEGKGSGAPERQAATVGAAPRFARSLPADATRGPAAGLDLSEAPVRETVQRAPASSPGGVLDAAGAAPDGWLIDTLRARSPLPGLAVEPGGTTIPIHRSAVAEAAGLRGGMPGMAAGAPPLPWPAADPAGSDEFADLDALAGRVRRILEDEVRRHGIDVQA